MMLTHSQNTNKKNCFIKEFLDLFPYVRIIKISVVYGIYFFTPFVSQFGIQLEHFQEKR